MIACDGEVEIACVCPWLCRQQGVIACVMGQC